MTAPARDDATAEVREEWIEWNGGTCPVGAVKVDIRKADGHVARDLWAHRLDWKHYEQYAVDGNIVAYRLSPPMAAPHAAEAGEVRVTQEALPDAVIATVEKWLARFGGFLAYRESDQPWSRLRSTIWLAVYGLAATPTEPAPEPVDAVREALAPFAKLGGPINGEEGRPAYVDAIGGNDCGEELQLSTYVGNGTRIEVMYASDFRRAHAVYTALVSPAVEPASRAASVDREAIKRCIMGYVDDDSPPTLDGCVDAILALFDAPPPPSGAWPAEAKFALGDHVATPRAPVWRGRICGWYRNSAGRLGYYVEADAIPLAIHNYPEAGLVAAPPSGLSADEEVGHG